MLSCFRLSRVATVSDFIDWSCRAREVAIAVCRGWWSGTSLRKQKKLIDRKILAEVARTQNFATPQKPNLKFASMTILFLSISSD